MAKKNAKLVRIYLFQRIRLFKRFKKNISSDKCSKMKIDIFNSKFFPFKGSQMGL